jgi:hypothetical protein
MEDECARTVSVGLCGMIKLCTPPIEKRAANGRVRIEGQTQDTWKHGSGCQRNQQSRSYVWVLG